MYDSSNLGDRLAERMLQANLEPLCRTWAKPTLADHKQENIVRLNVDQLDVSAVCLHQRSQHAEHGFHTFPEELMTYLFLPPRYVLIPRAKCSGKLFVIVDHFPPPFAEVGNFGRSFWPATPPGPGKALAF